MSAHLSGSGGNDLARPTAPLTAASRHSVFVSTTSGFEHGTAAIRGCDEGSQEVMCSVREPSTHDLPRRAHAVTTRAEFQRSPSTRNTTCECSAQLIAYQIDAGSGNRHFQQISKLSGVDGHAGNQTSWRYAGPLARPTNEGPQASNAAGIKPGLIFDSLQHSFAGRACTAQVMQPAAPTWRAKQQQRSAGGGIHLPCPRDRQLSSNKVRA